MAALAESLVDEWLNRQGFFTVRGLRRGVDEIDLLAVRPKESSLEAWHVEVQASFRPMAYISAIPKELISSFGAGGRSAKKRSSEILRHCVAHWVHGKYLSKRKVAMREDAWPKQNWQYVLVHAESRWPDELKCIAACGVSLSPLHTVLAELQSVEHGALRGGAGTDITELISYYGKHANASNEHET